MWTFLQRALSLCSILAECRVGHESGGYGCAEGCALAHVALLSKRPSLSVRCKYDGFPVARHGSSSAVRKWVKLICAVSAQT